jgi:phosphoglucosamine mutase
MRETGSTLGELAGCLRKFPQVLVNVAVRTKPPIDSLAGLDERVRAFESEMDGSGRIVIRYSGTEPLARVMIEGADGDRIRAMADELAGLIRTLIGAP